MFRILNYMLNFLMDFFNGVGVIAEKIYHENCLLWALAPLWITLLLPTIVAFILYLDAFILHVYTLSSGRITNPSENGGVKAVTAIWDAIGNLWHGYEIVGLENIPDTGGALLVVYHGAIPIDLYYCISRVFLRKNRLIYSVGDRFLFKVPGFSAIAENLRVIPGTVEECSNIMKNGNIMAISPGGVYEAQFGNSYYELLWKNRLGFAKAALDAKKPIIPMFTQNLREAFITMTIGKKFWLQLYSWTRFPLAPIFGGFPVKLTTYIGKPIPYEPLTPEELRDKVANSLKDLIAEHQKTPGSIIRALTDRFYTAKKTKNS